MHFGYFFSHFLALLGKYKTTFVVDSGVRVLFGAVWVLPRLSEGILGKYRAGRGGGGSLELLIYNKHKKIKKTTNHTLDTRFSVLCVRMCVRLTVPSLDSEMGWN